MHSCSVIEDSGGGSVLGASGLGLSPPGSNSGPFDDGSSCLVAIAALITEGRMPPPALQTKRPFTEGPHCAFSKRAGQHICNGDDQQVS